ncbi:LCP family protein [Actinoplanes sp. NPDC051851]|uniref:LCP family protein n=1 Tax=Actinoplanes sp. NPDC051851 TaxID=3154753 RepID=UPI0034186E35
MRSTDDDRAEQELRAAFERHEGLAPDAGPVREKIDFAWLRAKRRRARLRVAGAAVAVLLVGAALPVVIAGWRHGGQPATADLLLGTATAGPAAGGPVDLLVIGGAEIDADDQRADTLMLVHVAAGGTGAWMVSLPREGEVDTPDRGPTTLGESLRVGGPSMTRDLVEEITGVDLDEVVMVDYAVIGTAAKALGGVRVCLGHEIPATTGAEGFHSGCQQIDATEVTAFLKSRPGVADVSYGRDRNTQALVRALLAKVPSDGTGVDGEALKALALAAGKDIEFTEGEGAALVTSLRATGLPTLTGISDPTPGTDIYPEVSEGLYEAIRDDTLAGWSSAHPDYVLD